MELTENVTGVQHIGLPTGDLEKTVAFYQSLGFSLALRTGAKPGRNDVCFMKLKNLCMEIYAVENPARKIGAIDHIALDVRDIESAFATAKKLGLHLLDQEICFLPFWKNGVRFFTILGPNEEKIEFSQML